MKDIYPDIHKGLFGNSSVRDSSDGRSLERLKFE
jgi:hypothetical protein